MVLVEKDDQQTILLKEGALDERVDIGLKPGISLGQRPFVSVVIDIGHNPRILGQCALRQVVGEVVGEVHHVGALRRNVRHIGEVGKGVVVFHVSARVATRVARRGDALDIGLPGLAGRQELAHNVVIADHTRGRGAIPKLGVVPFEFTYRRHEIVVNRRVCVGGVAGRQTVFRDQGIEVGHAGTTFYLGVAVVLFHDDEHMPELRQ